MTRVLVLRTGQAVSRVHAHCGPFYRLFQRCLNDGAADAAKVAVDEMDITQRAPDDALPDLARYHGAIMTGSPAFVGDDEPWMRWGQRFIRTVVDKDALPFLAVCFGHQLMGVALGADVGKNPRGREMGTIDVNVTNAAVVADDPLWATMPRAFVAQCTHRDVIRGAGQNLVVLGNAKHDDNHVVKAGRRQWGVQFHPEFDDTTMRLYLEVRREILDRELGENACNTRLNNVTVTAEAAGLLRRFASLAHDEAHRRG